MNWFQPDMADKNLHDKAVKHHIERAESLIQQADVEAMDNATTNAARIQAAAALAQAHLNLAVALDHFVGYELELHG